MKTLRMDPNESGAFPSIQNDSSLTIPPGHAFWPAELPDDEFYQYKGFIIPQFQHIDAVEPVPATEDTPAVPGQPAYDVVIGYEPNLEAYNAWQAEHPDPIPEDPVDVAKREKLGEVDKACNETIVFGCDVSLSDGTTGHIRLTDEDQINLTTALNAVSAGAASYPYHLDGKLCAMYPAADIHTMAQTATAFKLYHTTYVNHLHAWIKRCETVEEVETISYGVSLPDDLQANMDAVLASAATVSNG